MCPKTMYFEVPVLRSKFSTGRCGLSACDMCCVTLDLKLGCYTARYPGTKFIILVVRPYLPEYMYGDYWFKLKMKTSNSAQAANRTRIVDQPNFD